MRYNKLKKDNFCHNCYKIIDAVESFVAGNNGNYTYNEVNNTFELICENFHKWSVEFKSKQ